MLNGSSSEDERIVFPCTAVQSECMNYYNTSRDVSTSLCFAGALFCDRNMYWKDKLQACLGKDKTSSCLHSTHCTRTLYGREANSTHRCWEVNVWKCMKNRSRQQPSISTMTDATLPLYCPPLWVCEWRRSDSGSDTSNHPRLWPEAHQSVGDTVSDHQKPSPFADTSWKYINQPTQRALMRAPHPRDKYSSQSKQTHKIHTEEPIMPGTWHPFVVKATGGRNYRTECEIQPVVIAAHLWRLKATPETCGTG